MRGTLPALLCGLICLATMTRSAAELAAQAEELEPGARIRVITHDLERVVGTFGGMANDTLLIVPVRRGALIPLVPDSLGRLRLPLTSMRRVQVSDGFRNGAAEGARLGFLIGGAAVGGAMFIVCSGMDDCPRMGVPLLYGGLGAVAGAGIGAMVGQGNGERWRTIVGLVPEP